MRYKDFWDEEIPQELLDLGFVDRSWKNDAGPRMVHCLQLGLDDDLERTTPLLNIMAGGERQADELGHNDFAYTAYWNINTINGLEPAPGYEDFNTADYQKFLAYLKETAIPMLAKSNPPGGQEATNGQ